MERIEIFVICLWAFVLCLVALNIAYHTYLKITQIYMKYLDTIRFWYAMSYIQIRYFFSKVKKTLSFSTTQQSLDTLTLSDLYNPAPHAQPTSQKQSCNPPKKSSKKRDTKGRYVRN